MSSLQRQAADFRAAAADVLVLTAPGEVSGLGCDDLSQLAGVEAAGAVRSTSRSVVPSVTPNARIPLFVGTRGFASLLGGSPFAGVLVERKLAGEYELAPGSTLMTNLGGLPIGALYDFPSDGRNLELQFGLVALGQEAAPYDECWIEVWPFSIDKGAFLYSALVPGPSNGASTSVAQLNSTLGSSLGAGDQFRSRPSRLLQPAAFLWVALVVLGVAGLRRLELAYCRHLGAGRVLIALQLTVEYLTWVPLVLFAVLGMLLAFYAAGYWTAAAVGFGLSMLSWGFAGGLLGSTAAGLMTREGTLFRYFKRRI